MLIPSLRLTAAADCSLVGIDGPSERVVRWTITAPDVPLLGAARSPLNLALVVDRSGSMAGDKLAYARQAANHVLDLLHAEDRVTLVVYDDVIEILAPSQLVTVANREALKTMLQTVTARGSTNLGEGWLRGAGQVAEHLSPGSINRVLLLTDGLANQGIVAPAELATHARELRQRGVSTSTFGIGADFNEQLLALMADDGGGHFYFIETPAQIPALFQQELGELLTVVARDPRLVISGPNQAAVDLLGGLPFEYDGDRLIVPLSHIFAREERQIFLRAVVLPGLAGSRFPIRGELAYRDLSGDPQTAFAEVFFTYADPAAVAAAPIDLPLRQGAAEIRLSAVANQALKLKREGRQQEAVSALREALASMAPLAAPAVAQNYDKLAQELDTPLSPAQVKARHYEEYRKRKSR